ncbi:iron-sulfur cluster-binding domain-containing protein, partial [Sphingomonadaceae bacterium G21617-S1]|nr:iron-sulfur cluster-binding domain-containing protein [Sphingomonadaceae bacterium G21617-S1]
NGWFLYRRAQQIAGAPLAWFVTAMHSHELSLLAAAHPDRLTVIHWLESVQGLPSEEQLRSMVQPWSSYEAFICGPEPFMAAVQRALVSLGMPERLIHLERFISLPDEDPADTIETPAGEDVRLTVSMDGEQRTIIWPRNAKMLDTMLTAGVDAPYSCRVGGCSACMCRVTSGEVRMAKNLVLDEKELEEGWILACQSFPISDGVEVEIPS